uniref:collagen binding domain-containing protein n=1 Tax=Saccharibacillus sp. CPCC 101409 TaxID=3058041 RepID=UPI002671EA62|nr:collagen binding domain-containing protein [Saccharibacillus sp. CPCC 101409]
MLILHSLLGWGGVDGQVRAEAPEARPAGEQNQEQPQQSEAGVSDNGTLAEPIETHAAENETRATETESAGTEAEQAESGEPEPTGDEQNDTRISESAAVEEDEQSAADPAAAKEDAADDLDEEAAVYPANILTSVKLTDEEGRTIEGDAGEVKRFDPQSTILLNYSWALPGDHTYKAGSTFEFDLPSEFRIYTEIRDVPLSIGEGTQEAVGSFGVTTDGHVTVTFNRFVEEYSEISGTLTVRTELKEEAVKESTEVRIPFPIGDTERVVVLVLLPKNGALLDKKGEANSGGGSIDWTVDINTSLQRLNGVVLNDKIPDGLTLDAESVQVYRLQISASGQRTLGEPLPKEAYTLAADESGELRVAFGAESVVKESYRIVYSTGVGAGAQTQFTNTATLAAQGIEPATASATVTVKRGELLSKAVGAYDRESQSIDWIVRYNAGSLTIPAKEALLQDRFNSGQKLVEGTLKVTETGTNRLLAEGTDYTVKTVPVSGGRTGFDLQFVNEVKSAHTVTYRTAAAGAVYANDRITNTITTGKISKSASQTLQRSLLTKTNTGVNYKLKTASWRSIVNEDRFSMENAVLTDTFTNGGLELVPDSLKVLTSTGKALPAADYTLTIPEGNRSGFTIRFNRTLTDSVTVTYTTKFNQTWKTDRKQADFVNSAKVVWSESRNSRSREVVARFTPDTLTQQNGSKSGSYNAQTKELTWDIKANYNNLALNGAVLTDTIRTGQRYVEGSLTVHNLVLTGSKNGAQKGAVASPADYRVTPPDESNGNELRIAFNKPIDTPYWITFKTTVDGQIVGSSAVNEASLDSEGSSLGTWSASVPIPGGSEYVSKTGAQQGSRIDWNVTINRGQSYVENAKVTDTPTRNQVLDEESFRVYRADAAADGSLSRGQELVKGRDYTLKITSGDTERFELLFAGPIRQAFILEYQSVLYASDRETVSNEVSFEGTGVTTGQVESSRSIVVRTSSGSGTGAGVRGALEVTKVDAADPSKYLAGATFELQDAAKRRPAVTRTTDENGRIVFGQLLYGSYTLTETQAPEGYRTDEAQRVRTVVIDANARQEGGLKKLTVANEAAPVVPGEPGNPPDSGTPGEPGTPPDGGTPTEPGIPQQPDTPVPTGPGVPVTPGPQPEQPLPGTPPNNPDNSGPPAVPVIPDEPGAPVPDSDVPQGVPVPGEPGPSSPPQIPEPASDTPVSDPAEPQPEVPVPGDDTPRGTPQIPAPGQPETAVPGEPVPQGIPPIMPAEPYVPVPGGDIPQETPPTVPGTVVPEGAPILPQTGEESRLPFALAGLGLLAIGFLLHRYAKTAKSQK